MVEKLDSITRIKAALAKLENARAKLARVAESYLAGLLGKGDLLEASKLEIEASSAYYTTLSNINLGKPDP